MIPNQWYPILESHKLGDEPLHVRRCGRDLVLWRRPNGRVVVQEDRCPHKGVRLSRGRVVGNQIECPYHGFLFDAEGTCTHAPCMGSGGRIPANMVVSSMVAREEHEIVWFWYGDSAKVREELPIVPQLANKTAIHGRVSYERPVHYTRYIESLLEFYHVPWVHRGEWYNMVDDFAVGGLSAKARERYYNTTKVVNSECKVGDQRIDYSFELVNEKDPTAPAFPWKIVFIAPGLVYFENEHFNGAQWNTPVDDHNTFLMFQFCGFKNLRVPTFVNKLLTKATMLSQRYGQDSQDFLTMLEQTPKISEVGSNVFVAADELNSQYLQLRRKLKREAENPLKVVPSSSERGVA